MSRLTVLSRFLALGLTVALSDLVIGQDAPSTQQASKKYRALIEQLASPNEEAMTRNGGHSTVTFPTGYDVQAQNRIEAARQTLQDNFEEALPFLLDALDDKRYSMTIDWAEGDAYYNYSVGRVCRDVIASQLEVYRDLIWFSGPQHWHRYDYKEVSKKWLPKQKGRSLADLQIAAIDWAIEQRMAEGRPEDVREEQE